MERRQLGKTDIFVSTLGFGAAALGNLYSAVSDEAAFATVAAAFDAGVRYFDTAPYYGYGLAERRLGQALETGGTLDRTSADSETIVVSTKVGRLLVPRPDGPRSDQGFIGALPFDPVFDYSYDGVMRSFEQSLERLAGRRIDVLYLHDLGERTHGGDHARLFREAMEGGVRALTELRKSGDVRAIGVGVNECEVLLDALTHGDFDCFLLAGRFTLLDQSALERLLPRCAQAQVSLVIGGPYNSGILASRPTRQSRYDYAAASPEIVERAIQIESICRSHRVPLAAAALQFPLLHPVVASVIPGARSSHEAILASKNAALEIPAALWSDLQAAELIEPMSLGGSKNADEANP